MLRLCWQVELQQKHHVSYDPDVNAAIQDASVVQDATSGEWTFVVGDCWYSWDWLSPCLASFAGTCLWCDVGSLGRCPGRADTACTTFGNFGAGLARINPQ